MGCFVKKYLALQRIGNAIVVNIKELDIVVLFVIGVVLKLPENLFEEIELVISLLQCR